MKLIIATALALQLLILLSCNNSSDAWEVDQQGNTLQSSDGTQYTCHIISAGPKGKSHFNAVTIWSHKAGVPIIPIHTKAGDSSCVQLAGFTLSEDQFGSVLVISDRHGYLRITDTKIIKPWNDLLDDNALKDDERIAQFYQLIDVHK
jgi:hypothetical protein